MRVTEEVISDKDINIPLASHSGSNPGLTNKMFLC